MAATQLPSDRSLSLNNSMVVAVDKDKNSLQAFRYALDNLMTIHPFIVLLHVRHKNHQYQVSNGCDYEEAADLQLLFHTFRPYCVRKRVQVVEVVLDDVDVSRAILDFINKNSIGTIVVGSSPKNALTRKFRNQDIPSTLIKLAPDFCSVYVVARGKVLTSRTAYRPTHVTPNVAVPARLSCPQTIAPHMLHSYTGLDDGDREQSGKVVSRSSAPSTFQSEKGNNPLRGVPGSEGGARNYAISCTIDSIDYGISASRISNSCDSIMSDDSEFSIPISIGSPDYMASDADFSTSSGSPGGESNAQSSHDLEAEMRRLKLELKQTMDMYSTACKEALSAKKKAEEAQKLAEMEAQKRKHAEKKAQREAEEKNRALNALAYNDMRYRRYTIEEIETATENFAESMKIGEGGYGPVYKGKLDHTPVAIKVLRSNAAQGKKQFQQEVEVLSSMRHPHLVLLLGACPEYGCLVYEYMDFGSLEDRLFQKGNTPPLSWKIRFKIAAEIATALLFLHQAKPEPLVHRDLKPANILLDHNYASKISDVGLARLVPASVVDSVTQYHMTSAAGTFCYIDPEYQQTGKLNTRSDLYSLGILFLQIITSRPPIGLAHKVAKAIERGNFADILDKAVPDWPVEEALKFAKLSLKCAELRKRDRPNLDSVIIPELIRLRDLGQSSEPQSSRSDICRPPDSNRTRSCGPLPPSLMSTSHAKISNGIIKELDSKSKQEAERGPNSEQDHVEAR